MRPISRRAFLQVTGLTVAASAIAPLVEWSAPVAPTGAAVCIYDLLVEPTGFAMTGGPSAAAACTLLREGEVIAKWYEPKGWMGRIDIPGPGITLVNGDTLRVSGLEMTL